MKITANILLILILTVFFSCATAPVEEEPVTEPVIIETPSEPEEHPVVKDEPEEEVIVSDETGFEVSIEVYEQTFDEITALIEKLNGIISDRKYDTWKRYLSDSYISTYNDRATLREIGESSKILSDNNIELKTLKDYFEWVVVPSRSRATVDDIVFSDDKHLTVYTLIKDKRTILYQLEKFEDNWLISVW
ncbi:MAG: hypothetical protein PQJ50_07160 [Spirochaetales bacterium]|nr:hypothetical protein [Spirochaetales bacterium]